MADNESENTNSDMNAAEPSSEGSRNESSTADSVEEGSASKLSSFFEVKEERAGLRKGIYLLPNLITTGALFSGFYSIISSMSGNLENAAIAIIVSGILDGLDGRIARMTNTSSEFGVQYDSLSDMVAFGVAPAVLMFSWCLSDIGKFGWMAAFIYMACGALRLARFNTKPDNESFTGLASPGAAGIIACMVWVWVENLGAAADIEIAIPAAVLTAIIGLLMVSNVRYFSPKKLNIKGQVPFVYMLALIATFALVLSNPPVVLLIASSVYAASGPIQALLRSRESKA